MTKRTILFLLCGSLSFAACGDDDGVADTGPLPDAGPTDSGPPFDGGPDFDAGPRPDAGPPPDPTCENLCGLAMMNCDGDAAAYASMADCMTFCGTIGAWEAGTAGDATGNTIACRINALQASDCNAGGFTGGGVCGTYCENLCSNLENTCTGSDAVFDSEAACNTACADLNMTGLPGTTGGDSVQCRIYHAGIPANMSPATHCPHAGVISADGVCATDTMDFDFRTDEPSAYTRVDRVGMPAVSTALVTNKAAYNDGDPSDDATLAFAGELLGNLGGLHTALDPEIEDAMLTPCSMDPSDPMDATSLPICVAQAVVTDGPSVVSLVVPDVLTLDTASAAGFPNGRLLTDPVIDVTLAIVLLDMTVHAPSALVGVLNPDANDVAFRDVFPYLAAAQ